MSRSIRLVLLQFSIFLAVGFLISSCNRSKEGFIVVTETYSENIDVDIFTAEAGRLNIQMQLVLIDPEEKGMPGNIISGGFYSACSPNVSYDGKIMVFSAQKKQGDIWQIWKMDLGSLQTDQVTNLEGNSTDPALLPDGRILFSYFTPNDSIKAGYSLYTCNPDGSDLRRITFNPHNYLGSSVLMDGRIITYSQQTFPEKPDQKMMCMRPDGTKAELFYEGTKNNRFLSKVTETAGNIYFIESADSIAKNGNLAEISYNRPLHSKKIIGHGNLGSFLSVAKAKQGNLLVSYKNENEKRYSLYDFDFEKGSVCEKIYSSGNNVIEAVFIQVQDRPRKLPSEVDFGVKTGLLLCQNINLTGLCSPETGFSATKAKKIEVLGINKSYGVAEVESDGSIYLKIAADLPFRIQTLDSLDNVVEGPGAWYYLRPNERRGCVGCHEDNEITPANRYSKAVSKNPVMFPTHLKNIREKEVELE